MANEEWGNLREPRYYSQHLPNDNNIYYNSNSTTAYDSYSYGQSLSHRTEPIHRRRASLIDTSTQHPAHHNLALSHLYNRRLSTSGTGQSALLGRNVGDLPGSCHYPRAFRIYPHPDEDIFQQTSPYRSPHVFPTPNGLYPNTFPHEDPRLQRYRLRDTITPIFPCDYNHGVDRRNQTFHPPRQPAFSSSVQNAVNCDFPADQSPYKHHTLLDHNIGSQYHSPNTNGPSEHDNLPIFNKNYQAERKHSSKVVDSSKLGGIEGSTACNTTTGRQRRKENITLSKG